MVKKFWESLIIQIKTLFNSLLVEPRMKGLANKLQQQAIEKYYSGEFTNAFESLQQALTIYQKIGDRYMEGSTLNNIGAVYESLSKYSQAIELYERALLIRKELGDIEGEAATLNNIGAIYRNLNQYDQAIELYQQAVVIAKQIDNQGYLGQIFSNIGEVYRNLNQYSQALEFLQQALSIQKALQDYLNEGVTLNNIGLVYSNLGDYPQALEYLQQSLVIDQENNRLAGQCRTLHNIGSIYLILGEYSQALESLQQALTIQQKIGDRASEGETLNSIGNIYSKLSQYDKSLAILQQALSIHRDIGNLHGEATTLNTIANVYQDIGQYSQAIELYEQALAIQKEVGNRADAGVIINNIGLIYQQLAQYPKALDSYQQALALQEEFGRRAEVGRINNNIGSVYDILGQYSQAIKYFQKSLDIHREIGVRLQEATTLNNIGEVYRNLGEYSQSLEFLQEALVIEQELDDYTEQGTTLNNIGLVYFNLSQYEQAKEFLQKALVIRREVRNKYGEGQTLSNIAAIYYYQHNYKEAQEYLQQSLVIRKEIGDRYGEGVTLNNIGSLLYKSDNLLGAERELLAAVEIWESLRPGLIDSDKVAIFETQRDSYQALQNLLFEQNKIEASLEVAERGRSRAFVELLVERLTPQLANQLTSQSPNIQQIKEIAQQQNSTLVEYSIIYAKFLLIWVIKPTHEIICRRVDLEPLYQKYNSSLENFVASSRFSLGVRGRDAKLVSNYEIRQSEKQFLRELYDLLIQPIEEFLPTDTNARVTFIPQGALFLLPFPALQDTEGKYLIEKHTILTSPSIQVLELTRQQQVKELTSKTLIVGNPTMPKIALEIGQKPQKLRPLPGSEQEAIEIACLLKTKYLTGDEATKTAILENMPTAGIIHLATHGLLDDFQDNNIPGAMPSASGAIALAPCGDDNGILTSEEIFGLKLQAELLVLSACDTGRGRVTGDGVIGLSRSFISAGVSSIVVSLWSVPDDSTAFLMTAFYQNLKNNLDKAQALRQAMLMTMKENPNPRYWAAFTLIGEAEWGFNLINI